MTTAAMYARASSASQKEEETIVSQTAELKGYAISLGLVVPLDWIFEDEGFSGSTLIRQPWSGCETWSLRSTSGCYSAMHPIAWPEDTPIRCCSWKSLPAPERKSAFSRHRPGDTPEAALLVQVQGVIAEYEKAQILERTRRGKVHRAKAGSVSVLSGVLFGYRYVRKGPDTAARYEILERFVKCSRPAERR
jgi:site-specific DNA recombinase